MTTDTTQAPTILELEERIKLLEQRVKRIANERNEARAKLARVCRVAEPFADHTATSLKALAETESAQAIRAWSKALAVAIEDQDAHKVVYRALRAAEALATNILEENPRDIRANRVSKILDEVFVLD
ncbi:hypothetical protein CEY09_01995 [Achromobacter marplatensis]|mgnify:CR=1 FL=1|uniref:Uncharacterized protein n=1 Tax=Achromobacter marplatensis TaxID=470868 RepID=A0ABX9GJB2_9BURK|nr:hypothetical protein [Achromobacter marplatensis]OWT72313.1 hypothetical protein CEY09_01995 [Achromobacter marplatensis]RBP24400.1 hypothetical protein DFP87_101910 [Achromobacter marplatensis]CAB3626840.1 hypothetical protein LMG26219_00398 [Achromobacter marplatensis]